jgi:hypothetical protein
MFIWCWCWYWLHDKASRNDVRQTGAGGTEDAMRVSFPYL